MDITDMMTILYSFVDVYFCTFKCIYCTFKCIFCEFVCMFFKFNVYFAHLNVYFAHLNVYFGIVFWRINAFERQIRKGLNREFVLTCTWVTIASVAIVTVTFERSDSICTLSIFVTVVGTFITFINICINGTIC